MRYYAQISEIIDQMQENEREYRKTMSDRLREARWSAGFESMALAAERVGKTASTYRAHENGQNDYSHVEAQVYAKAFGVTAEWLLFGGNAPFVDGAPDIGSAREGEILNFHQIARLRKRRGLTQKRLAELAGTSQPQIRRLENGERQLTRDWAERLAPHLGITAKELVFPDSMEPKDRLRLARERSGFKSPTEAARSIRGLNVNTLTSNENGNALISKKMAQKYAEIFGVSAGWLLFGDTSHKDLFSGLGVEAPKTSAQTVVGQSEFLAWLSDRLKEEGRGAQKRLAEHLGWEPSAMTRLLSGNRKVSLDDAREIEKHFELSTKLGVTPILVSIEKKIRAIMKVTGWNQQQVAEKFSVSQPTVNRWLSGSEPRGNVRDAINDQFAKLVENQTETQNRPTDTEENSLRHATFPTIDGPVEIRFPKEFSTEGLRQLERYFSAFIENEKDS